MQELIEDLTKQFVHLVSNTLAEEEATYNRLLPYHLIFQRIFKDVENNTSMLCERAKFGTEVFLSEMNHLEGEERDEINDVFEQLEKFHSGNLINHMTFSAKKSSIIHKMISKLVDEQRLIEANDLTFFFLLLMPDSLLLWMTMGRIEQELKHWHAAIAIYERVNQLCEQNEPWVLLFLADCYEQVGMRDQAQETFERLTKKNLYSIFSINSAFKMKFDAIKIKIQSLEE
ncbi:MAG: tetratricopeptide repeat protein [Chlamydiales bacterium]